MERIGNSRNYRCPITGQILRKCSNCFLMKDPCEYYPKGDGGLKTYCKACNAEVVAGFSKTAKDRIREKYDS